ncbi:MAG: hypothetical protein IT190_10305, partial [Microbacteriaceae bacterium]|nr:hypothetical protein [Microbacteriaceae bacterium]
SDPASYRVPRLPALYRWAGPPGAWHLWVLLTLALCALLELSAGPPDASLLLIRILPWAFAVVMVPYVGRALASLWCAWRLRSERVRARPWRSVRWFALPASFMLIAWAVADPWPLKLRFALSRRAFEQVLQDIRAGRHQNFDDQWIGLYRVHRIRFASDECEFELARSREKLTRRHSYSIGFRYREGDLHRTEHGLGPGWAFVDVE